MDKKSEVYAKHRKARISPKKVVPVMDLIRGKSIHDAKVTLAFDTSKAAKMVLKVLKSAEANAQNNNKLDVTQMYVSEAWVGAGAMAKWYLFKGRGRVSPILKRTSHICLGISTIPGTPKKVKKSNTAGKKVTKGGKK